MSHSTFVVALDIFIFPKYLSELRISAVMHIVESKKARLDDVREALSLSALHSYLG
jgi:hypothetical protein